MPRVQAVTRDLSERVAIGDRTTLRTADPEPRRAPGPQPSAVGLCCFAAVHALSEDERTAVAAVCAPAITTPARSDLVVEGEHVKRGFILEDGWACRYRLLNDGRRQILNFIVPGDCIGAVTSGRSTADHSVGTVTACRVYSIPAGTLSELQRRVPALRRAFERSVRRDLAILRERVVDLGRRTARERLAHLLLELLHRLRLVGLSNGRELDLPLTQEVLADALGLSIVHVNRTLRSLNGEGVIRYRPGRIAVVDARALMRIAEFDAAYLHAARSRDAQWVS